MPGILGRWLDGIVQQNKQMANAGKSAEFAVKADPSILDQIGATQEDFDNWGAREKALAVQGVFTGRGAKQAAAEAEAQTQLRLAQAAKAQEDDNATTGFPDFAKYLNEEMSGAPQQPPMGTPDWHTFLKGGGPGALVQTPGTPAGGGTMTATNGQPQGLPMGQAVLRALAKVQSMNPRVAAAIASKVLPQMIANNSGDDSAPIATTLDTPTGPLGVISKRGSKEFLLDPRAAIDARTQGQKDVLTVKSAPKELTAEDRLKSLDTQITAIRRVPATMRNQEDADDLAQLMQARHDLLGGASASKQLTPELARQYMKKAAGDKEKARNLAKADGYTF